MIAVMKYYNPLLDGPQTKHMAHIIFHVDVEKGMHVIDKDHPPSSQSMNKKKTLTLFAYFKIFLQDISMQTKNPIKQHCLYL